MRRKVAVAVGVAVAVPLVLGVISLGVAGCSGHVIRARHAPNHAADFDVRDPPCEANRRVDRSPGDVVVRYLGAGGVAFERDGHAVVTAPYFSNAGLWRVAFGKARPDEAAVERGARDLPVSGVRAVLIGHAHYDHLSDLPTLLRGQLRGVTLVGSPTARNALDACDLDGGFVDATERIGTPFALRDGAGAPVPIRVTPLRSGHAPHLRGFHWADGKIDRPTSRCADEMAHRALKGGEVLAFLVDFMDGEEVAFRVYYQDAVPAVGTGLPRPADGRRVDLAILCLPSYWLVDGFPESAIEALRPRHVWVTHYENFFEKAGRPRGFAPLVSDRRANAFLDRVDASLDALALPVAGPRACGCGPCGDRVTVPLPGEALVYATGPGTVDPAGGTETVGPDVSRASPSGT